MTKMSKLKELIQQYCPDGVPNKTLGELGKFFGGLTGKSKDDFTDGNAKFITYKNVYANPALQIDVEDRVKIAGGEKQRTLQYGDVVFTGSSETPDECGISSVVTVKTEEKLYLNSFCFFFRFDDLSIMLPDFAKHLFRSNELRYQIGKTASGVTRYNVSKKLMEKVSIPVPPLPVQREIVRILDKFTALIAELTAELTARKKQYEFYRDKLLTFGDVQGGATGDVVWRTLAEIADISTGSSNTDDAVEGGCYPFFVRSQQPLAKDEYEYDEEAIITAGDGVGVGKVFHYINGKYALHQRAYRIHPATDGLLGKYLYHYFVATFPKYIGQQMYQGSVPSIRRPMLNKFQVAIPSLDVQSRIVNVLDNFDAICSDLKIGLPAEIEARKKQYEFYREKLLAFHEISN